jgi:hypothetical protein
MVSGVILILHWNLQDPIPKHGVELPSTEVRNANRSEATYNPSTGLLLQQSGQVICSERCQGDDNNVECQRYGKHPICLIRRVDCHAHPGHWIVHELLCELVGDEVSSIPVGMD